MGRLPDAQLVPARVTLCHHLFPPALPDLSPTGLHRQGFGAVME